MLSAPVTVPLPQAVDLDDDLKRRTPSGWPTQAVPPPLRVRLAGVDHVFAQGRTAAGLHACLWPISRLVVRYIEAHAAEFDGTAVLELGSGVGLAGVGAAAHGAAVVLTDKDVSLTRTNVDAATSAGLAGSAVVEELDWEQPAAFLGRHAGQNWTWVLCSDCVYHQQGEFGHLTALAELLVSILSSRDASLAPSSFVDDAPAAASPPPPRVLFAYQERDSVARLHFWGALAARGLVVEVVTLEALRAERKVDTSGLDGPMALWWIRAGGLAPAEAVV